MEVRLDSGGDAIEQVTLSIDAQCKQTRLLVRGLSGSSLFIQSLGELTNYRISDSF